MYERRAYVAVVNAYRTAFAAALTAWLVACGNPSAPATGDLDADVQPAALDAQPADVDVADAPEVAPLEVDVGPDENDTSDAVDAADGADVPEPPDAADVTADPPDADVVPTPDVDAPDAATADVADAQAEADADAAIATADAIAPEVDAAPPESDSKDAAADATATDTAAFAACDPAACPTPSAACQVAICNTDSTCGFGPAADGTPCDDGDACTADACASGGCVGAKKICDDGNACTDDTCNSASGCVFSANTSACNDGNACTLGDACTASACLPGSVTACSDDNACTDDLCNPVSGCVNPPNAATCTDNNACTVGEACSEGLCQGALFSNCDDSNPCSDDSCDPTAGCIHTAISGTCDDGSVCTTADACANMVCAGLAISCDDGIVCSSDGCDPTSGCTHTPANSGACDDGEPCTLASQCSGGSCKGTSIDPCDDGNLCTTDSCTAGVGCKHVATNYTLCNDGNGCTQADICISGVCQGLAPLNCDDGNACTTDSCSGGVCQHVAFAGNCTDSNTCTLESCNAGSCVHLPVAGTCSDGSGCTIGDVCDTGVCKPGADFVCPATTKPCSGGKCYSTGSQSHMCFTVALPDGVTCDADGNGCTENDVCKTGACVAGAMKNCASVASSDGCTGGACQSTGAASASCVKVFAPGGFACNDANGCTVGDACNATGTCVGGLPVDCSAVAANCYTGQCQATGDFAWTCATGAAKADGSFCDDGSACTQNDACLSATCSGGAVSCDDGDACTADSCAPQTGCKHSAIVCNDGSLCTIDTCASATGCVFTPGNDGAVCGGAVDCVAPVCSAGACVVPPGLPCDDGNGCTFDFCQPGNQCSNGHALAAWGTSYPGNGPTAADGDTFLVGTTVRVWSGGKWLTQQVLQGANTNATDAFGSANALSGDTVLIGAPGEDSASAGVNGNPNDESATDSGAVYVFVRSGTTWQQQAYLKASNPMAGAHFGSAVALHGDYAVVGAPEEMGCDANINGDQTWVGCSHGGAAYVFRRTGGTWSQIAYLKANLINEFQDPLDFGQVVAISNDAIFVGSSGLSSSPRFFDLAGNVVTANEAYVPSDAYSVLALDGHTAACGAYGKVLIFEKRDGIWLQTATVTNSNQLYGDNFGASLSLRGDRLLVGTPGEQRTATGIDGDLASPTGGFGIGAAFLFQRSGTAWSQIAYLKADNAWGNQEFGYAVALGKSFAFVTTYTAGEVSIYALDPQPCDDGNACTTDGCTANACSHSNNAIPCSDDNKCTIDACAGGSCQSAPTSGACDDGFSCTKNDNCASGACVGTNSCGFVCHPVICANGTCATTDLSCSDGDACTLDMCAYNAGCTFPSVAAEEFSFGSDVNSQNSGFGTAAAASGDLAIFGASNMPGVPKYVATGAVTAFSHGVGGWQLKRFLRVAQGEAGDQFGCAVGISGTSLVIGAKGEDSAATGVNGSEADNTAANSGAAYVLVPNVGHSTWLEQAYLKAGNTDAGDGFGSAVAISGDTVVIGAPGEDSNGTGQGNNAASGSGAVYVFVRSGGVWTQQAYLKPSNGQGGDAFGSAVSIDGDLLAVGAPTAFGSALGSGAVTIFTRTGTTWTQTAVLTASNGDTGDNFGSALALAGGTLVVGASGEDSAGAPNDNSRLDSGAAYVFFRQNATWSQTAYLKAAFPDPGDHFAAAVSLAGDWIGIGASDEDSAATGVNGDASNNALSGSGAVYVFSRSNGTWSPFAYLKSALKAGDGLGASVAFTGNWLFAGVPGTDTGPFFGNPLLDVGTARIFHLNQNCDDGNPCTNDACNGTDGCTHANNTSPCAVGTCVDGTCQ